MKDTVESDWVDEAPIKKAKPMKKKTAKKLTKKTDETKKVTVNFKILPKEARAIKFKAKALTNGNVTQMVRLAVLAWNPAKKTLEGIRKTTRA